MRMLFCYSDMTFHFKLKSHALPFITTPTELITLERFNLKEKRKKKAWGKKKVFFPLSLLLSSNDNELIAVDAEKLGMLATLKKKCVSNCTQRQHQSFLKPDVASEL